MQIDLLPGITICKETTWEDMIFTIYEMVRRTPKAGVVRSNRVRDIKPPFLVAFLLLLSIQFYYFPIN